MPEGPLIPVDVVRDVVLTEATRSPFEGRTKVFIIEEAERMNPAAQNALLKTLEEPHDDSVFILISDQEEELLETVRSRCRIARLEPVPESRIIELLKREGITDEVALLAARLSEGDLDRARAIAEDEAAAERRASWVAIPRRLVSPQEALDVATEVVAEARAAVKANEDAQKAEIVELAEAMGEGRGTAGARNALMKRHRRESRRVEEQVLVEALQSLGSFYRDVVAIRSGGVEAVANLDLIGELETWAGSPISDSQLLSATQRCIDAAATLPLNANVPLAIEATMLEVARLAPAPARVGAT
jgi:DNA polymerase-3 subunit delta'